MSSNIGRIGVLMGGPSAEREISLRSGKAVYEALQKEGYDVISIDIEGANGAYEKIREAEISVSFIALHGRFGEDGTIQRMLEILDIPYTGSGPEASRLSMDKVASREIFQRVGITVPRYEVFHRHQTNEGRPPSSRLRRTAHRSFSGGGRLSKLNLPVVVKPSCEGSSIGLSIVVKKDGLSRAMELAYQYGDRIIIEEYIRGKEITIGILDDEPLPVVQIVPKRRFYDYLAKYEEGMTEYLVPAPLVPKEYEEVQRAGLAAHHALGCRCFSRVDMVLSEEGIPFVLELNSIPGLTLTSLLPKAAKACGIDFAQLCLRLINSATSHRKDSCQMKPRLMA